VVLLNIIPLRIKILDIFCTVREVRTFAAWSETEYCPCFQISKQFSVRWERILERTEKIQTQMFRNLSLAREFAIMFCFT